MLEDNAMAHFRRARASQAPLSASLLFVGLRLRPLRRADEARVQQESLQLARLKTVVIGRRILSICGQGAGVGSLPTS